MKVHTEVILLFVLAAAFGSVSTFVWLNNFSASLDDFTQALLNVVAAFSGAWFAFRLQAERDRLRDEDVEAAALRRTQFALIAQSNKLHNIVRDVLQPVRDDPGRWLTMRPALEVGYGNARVEVEHLPFLLQNDADLLLKVQITEEAYLSVIDALNARSRVHIHEVQPVLERILAIPNAPGDPKGLEPLLGSRLVETLKQATDSSYSACENALKKNEEIQRLFGRVARGRHPGKPFLTMKLDV